MSRNKYEVFQDKNSLSVQLANAVKDFMREYEHQKEREEDRQWVFNKVMDSINIKIVDNASPAIEKIADEINRLIK